MDTTITTTISVKPDKLNKNFINYLKTRVVDLFTDKCSEDYGYITNVKKLNKIIDTNISPTSSDIYVIISITICCLKPKIDKKYTAKVCMIFSRGIFAKIEEKLKVLIPMSSLDNYVLNEDTNQFENKTNCNTIKTNDDINISIYDYEYSNGNFNCLGRVVV